MLESIPLRNILFLDIETAPQYPGYAVVPDPYKVLWEKKSIPFLKEGQTIEQHYQRAGIYAEFGKVICISCGYFTAENKFRMKSFYGDEEFKILTDFSNTLNVFCSGSDKQLCAHNGKEFDFPFLARRMVIHGVKLPAVLDTPGKKPWEVNHLDTMELWKFGDYKSYTSLVLLATVLNIPTPKDDIDGSRVWEVYWKEHDLQRIVTYCQKDVLTVAQIIRKFRGEELILPEEIEIAEVPASI